MKNHAMKDAWNMEKQLDWLLVRRIRLSSFQILYPLPRSATLKVAAILKHSGAQLQFLQLEENEKMVNTIAVTISQYCTNVKTLTLGDMNLCAPAFAMACCFRNLKELVIVGCTLSVEDLPTSSCPSVKELSLQGEFSIQAQRAMLRMCSNITTYSFISAGEVDLRDLPHAVQTLSAESCSFIGTLKANLQKLVLYHCLITDNALADIVASSSHMQYLTISCGTLTDASMTLIGDKFGHSLQGLDMYKCGPVTVDGVDDLIKKCKGLTSLSVGINVHSDPVYIITALNNLSLRLLDISEATVSDETLAKIAAAPLETLILRNVTGHTGKGIVALMKGCAALKCLTIRNALVNPVVKLLWQEMQPRLKISI
eukprot:gene8261-9827_t